MKEIKYSESGFFPTPLVRMNLNYSLSNFLSSSYEFFFFYSNSNKPTGLRNGIFHTNHKNDANVIDRNVFLVAFTGSELIDF